MWGSSQKVGCLTVRLQERERWSVGGKDPFPEAD